MVRRRSVAGVAAVVAWALGGCTGEGSSASTGVPPSTIVAANAVVVRVVDGDTIDVVVDIDIDIHIDIDDERTDRRRERVRLIGIDTPEIEHDERPAECFGAEAAALTADLLPAGTVVRLERDVVGRDDYGRLLAYVYRAGDAQFVNRELVRRGAARPFPFPPNTTHADAFVDAARNAEHDDVGLWSICS